VGVEAIMGPNLADQPAPETLPDGWHGPHQN
jgi:hypothetical protein